jgi:hypothetical protein
MWKSKSIKCKCNFKLWITNQYNVDHIQYIRDHVYEHMFHQYMPYVCTTIVESYVGIIYYVPEYKMTLGLPFISNYDVNEKFESKDIIFYGLRHKCQIRNCGVYFMCAGPISFVNRRSLCDEHLDQWRELSTIHIHDHGCIECHIDLMITKQQYLPVIMKLHLTINRDIANIILAFCFVKSSYKCIGHVVPNKYVCYDCSNIMEKVD